MSARLGLVLVVDDDPGMRDTTIEVLRSFGLQAAGAGTVAEALSRHDVLDPGAVIVDYQLPGASGLQLAKDLKELDPELPILLLTAHASMDVAVAGVQYLDAYLTKPVAPEALVKVVREALERRALVLENRSLVERLQEFSAHQSLHDPLTGLPNRALFLDRLTEALAAETEQDGSVCVMFIDVDDFKELNDTLGHDTGDRLLVAMSRRLQRAIRADDTLARFGGDEFTVLCRGVRGPAEATQLAEQILDHFRAALDMDGVAHFARVSIGIALNEPSVPARAEIMLRNADTAMYHAKSRGKNRWELYDEEMRARVVKRFELERDLRGAISDGQLVLHYQPEVDLRHGTVVGAEALVRWQHPTRGLLPPSEFVPVAEQTQLIHPLGEEVLRLSVRQAATWRRDGVVPESFVMWVNAAPRQLFQPRFSKVLAEILTDNDLPAHCLGLEVTESGLVEDVDEAAAAMQEVRSLGVKFAVDDFGTGYSTLTWLQRLPIDVLKVDRTFVAGLQSAGREGAIVEALIALGHALDLMVVAEGIEDQVQLDILRAFSCDVGQGFLLARPVPADAGPLGRLHLPEPRVGARLSPDRASA